MGPWEWMLGPWEWMGVPWEVGGSPWDVLALTRDWGANPRVIGVGSRGGWVEFPGFGALDNKSPYGLGTKICSDEYFFPQLMCL